MTTGRYEVGDGSWGGDLGVSMKIKNVSDL